MPKWLKLGGAICLHQKKTVFPRTLIASLASLCLWLEPLLSDSVNRRRGRCFSATTAVIFIFYICSSTLIPSPRDFSWWGTKISGDTGVRDQQTFVISCQDFLFSSDSISISNPNYKLVEDFFFFFCFCSVVWKLTVMVFLWRDLWSHSVKVVSVSKKKKGLFLWQQLSPSTSREPDKQVSLQHGAERELLWSGSTRT